MTSDGPVIERLGPSDLGAMREMLGLFADAFGEADTYLGAQPSDSYLRSLLANDGFIALVARVGSEMAGALAAYDLVKFERQRSEIYVYDLAVAERHRRRGIATALIAALRPIARARGAWVIFVQADDGDEPAIALYRKLGVEERVLHFDIAVDR